MKRIFVILAGLLFAVFGIVRIASAGPVVIDGTDLNEHGQVVDGVNTGGWRYMQLALESLSQEVYTDTARTVVDLGTTPTPCSAVGHDARDAINSAFNLSSLPGKGWTLIHVDTAASITQWLQNLSTANTGILYIPTYNNLCGDLQSDEMDAINANPAALANFVNGPGDPTMGGALFAMGERNITTPCATSQPSSAAPDSVNCYPTSTGSTNAFLWLSDLMPGFGALSFSEGYNTPVYLTSNGYGAFPDLTNADISSGPWHNWFQGDMGSLSAFAIASECSYFNPSVPASISSILCGPRAVIIGGDKHTHFVVPTPTPTGEFTATKTGALLTDTDGNSVISPGDTLQYQVHIHNATGHDVSDVVYTDTPDPNTALVTGSVQTTAGTVVMGNNLGDTSVRVDIGTISNGGSVDIHYDTAIANPFPEGVITVTNQGVVSSTEGTTPTSDPLHPGPTVITITRTTNTALNLTAASSAPQCVLPGSSYIVTWTVTNVGDVVFLGGFVNSSVTGSGSGSQSTAIPSILTNAAGSITQTILVSAPVAYGSEMVTVTGNILTSTAVLSTQICAPDFRTSAAHVTSSPIYIGEAFSYTWQISNTGNAAAPGTTAVLTLPVDALFSYEDNLTSTFGTPSFDVSGNRVLWTGDLAVGQSVKVTFSARTGFGFPHGLIEAPFEVDHPYRPSFTGITDYIYPYKLFFMLVLKDSSPSPTTR